MLAGMIRLIAALAVLSFTVLQAIALVGGAPPANGAGAGRHVVMIVGSRGSSCTGTALARDLVLTAAHCVMPNADYKLVEFDAAHQPILKNVLRIASHPGFRLKTLLAHLATADLALLRLADPLPAAIVPAPLSTRRTVEPGDTFTVAGYGVTVRDDGRTGGTIRVAALAATGQPGNLQIRLVDPATRGERAGLGACSGDSGAPVFEDAGGELAMIGLVSWATGPRNSDGCGGITGVTPLVLYRDWMTRTARELGAPL
jgi:secreted trypsin-like serine protease